MNVHHHSEHLISFQILFLLGRPLSPWVKKIIQGNIETAAPFVDEVGGFGIFPKDLSSASPRYSYHLYLNQTAPGPGPTFEMVESEILDPGNVECYDRGPRWVCLSYVQNPGHSASNLVIERGATLDPSPVLRVFNMPFISANLERLS